MAKITDILLDTDNDLLIKDGDFVVGASTRQHQQTLLMGDEGSIRQFPLQCVGAMSSLDDESPDALLREIRKKFTRDGMNVKELSVGSDKKINVDAPYE